MIEAGTKVYFPKGVDLDEEVGISPRNLYIPKDQVAKIEGESTVVSGVYHVEMEGGPYHGQKWRIPEKYFSVLGAAKELQLTVQSAVERAIQAGMTPQTVGWALAEAGCAAPVKGWAGHGDLQIAEDAAAVIKFVLKHGHFAAGGEQFPNRECAEMTADALERIASQKT